jgi:hypothetical protein
MNETFQLTDSASIDIITATLETLLAFDKKHLVHIKPERVKTTTRQRKYYFKVLEPIAKFNGDSVVDLHWTYKEMFLVPILKRDPEYMELLQAANKLHQAGNMKEFNTIKRFIIQKTSLMDQRVAVIAEYITLVIQHGEVELGLTLPRPDDLKLLQYREAQ